MNPWVTAVYLITALVLGLYWLRLRGRLREAERLRRLLGEEPGRGA